MVELCGLCTRCGGAKGGHYPNCTLAGDKVNNVSSLREAILKCFDMEKYLAMHRLYGMVAAWAKPNEFQVCVDHLVNDKVLEVNNGFVCLVEPSKANTGLRYDEGKTRFDLIPIEWYMVLGRILNDGAIKYAPHNWENGMKYSRIVSSLLRHLFARLRGELLDKESGHPHMGHAAWNALALMSYDMRGIGENDLVTNTFTEYNKKA